MKEREDCMWDHEGPGGAAGAGVGRGGTEMQT